MSGQHLTQHRIAILEDMGEDAIAARYLEQGTVRRMIDSWERDNTFEPRAPGEKLAFMFFYSWLKQGGEERKAWWDSVKKLRGELDAEEAVDVVLDADTKTSHVARLQANTLQWRAERTNRSYSSKLDVNKTVTVDLGANLLEAIKANELNKQQTLTAIAEAEEGDAPFWETVEE